MRLTYLLLPLLVFSCSEPKFLIHEKLEDMLQNDLKFMVSEIIAGSSDTNVLEEPYYIVENLLFFYGDTAWIYSSYAEVDFYYFRDIPIKQKRKYRYDVRFKSWDRYHKELYYTK
ncbi:MAG: hypothetical protein GX801_02570 [Fibrobacter sp.]|nr:hypothetical protein [Fibrobacter sp.]